MSEVRIPNSLLFDGAGYFELTRYKEDGTLSTDPKDHYTSGPVLAGAIDATWSKATTEIKDENSEYPGAQRGGQVTSAVTLNQNTLDPYFDQFTKGAEMVEETGAPFRFINESYTIEKLENGTDYGFVLEENITAVSEDGEPMLVRDASTNADLTAAESKSALATGQYFCDADTKTLYFAAADAGKGVYVTYTGVTANTVRFDYPEGRAMQNYHLKLTGPMSDPAGTGDSVICCKTYDKVSLSGDANDATRQMDPSSMSVTYNVQKPRAGHKAISVKYLPAAE